jgi:hypothetical protein
MALARLPIATLSSLRETALGPMAMLSAPMAWLSGSVLLA